MKGLRNQLLAEKEELYCGSACEQLLERDDHSLKTRLRNEFKEFYKTALEYLEQWYDFGGVYEEMGWLELTEEPVMQHAHVTKAARALQIDINDDQLYRELIVTRQNYYSFKGDNTFASLPLDQKWVRILRGSECGNLLRIVSTMFAIPASNAPVERVFSLMELQWTDERNCLAVETVKALMITKINYDLTCSEMHTFLLNNLNILKLIGGQQKYM